MTYPSTEINYLLFIYYLLLFIIHSSYSVLISFFFGMVDTDMGYIWVGIQWYCWRFVFTWANLGVNAKGRYGSYFGALA